MPPRETWYDKPNGNNRAAGFKPPPMAKEKKNNQPWIQNGVAIIALLLAGMALGYAFHPAISGFIKTINFIEKPMIERSVEKTLI